MANTCKGKQPKAKAKAKPRQKHGPPRSKERVEYNNARNAGLAAARLDKKRAQMLPAARKELQKERARADMWKKKAGGRQTANTAQTTPTTNCKKSNNINNNNNNNNNNNATPTP